MHSILEQFALGNITPDNQPYDPSSPSGRAERALSEIEEKLSDRLNTEEKIILRQLVDAHMDFTHLTATENLIYGFKLGLLLTAETFSTADELFTA
ncbi:MAG: hypothetical protein FWE08_02665 [Oscillospiraceae bacterium]|nr:hypothetical protein [Oscillospiraceae bacterium]